VPVSIRALFAAVGLVPSEPIPWGVDLPTNKAGVYVVSLTPDPDVLTGTFRVAPISLTRIDDWLSRQPGVSLDGERTKAAALAQRLSESWLPDEVVLYVGKATNLRRRVRQFRETKLGEKKPHAGGYFLKTLELCPPPGSGEETETRLWVFYATAEEPERTEARMLAFFCAGSGYRLPALPFANLQYRKPHGIHYP